MNESGRLVCVSNRLPVTVNVNEKNEITIAASSGGLVTALWPVLERSGGTWIGWPGNSTAPSIELEKRLSEFSAETGFTLLPVSPSEADMDEFYNGFSNRIVWPLFHDLQSQCNFSPSFWEAFQRVQDQFADAVIGAVKADDFIWVHDFHLLGLGERMRARGLSNRCGFFLHIPFPPPDIFSKLPWRAEVLRSMLSYDTVGLQTTRDVRNFLACLDERFPVTVEALAACRTSGRREGEGDASDGRKPKERARRWPCRPSSTPDEADAADEVSPSSAADLKSDRLLETGYEIAFADRVTTLHAIPISIDFGEFSDLAITPEVGERSRDIRARTGVDSLAVSVDRLDYTKGIPDRIRAFGRMLERYPELIGKTALLQVVVPSRDQVPEYQRLRGEVEQLVTQINGKFGEPGWTPVQHFFRSITREELVAFYRAADVGLVTPLKDGMNLVCKEYCAAQVDGNGVLVLSEFAGAAEELGFAALLVNPYDSDGVADALYTAFKMPVEVRKPRMAALRETIRKNDVYLWADKFLSAAKWELTDRADADARNSDGVGFWQRVRRILSVFDL